MAVVARRSIVVFRTKVCFVVTVLAMMCALILISTAAPRAAAQGCAQCYQSAAASGAAGRAALRHGILILLVPAISLFVAILFFLYRRRDSAGNAPVSRLP